MNHKVCAALIILVAGGYLGYDHATSAPPVDMKVNSQLMKKFKPISPLDIKHREANGFGKLTYYPAPCYGRNELTAKGTSIGDNYAIWGCMRSDCPDMTVKYKDDSTVIVKANINRTEYSKDEVLSCALTGLLLIEPELRATNPEIIKSDSWN